MANFIGSISTEGKVADNVIATSSSWSSSKVVEELDKKYTLTGDLLEGNLNAGTYNIITSGLVDGVDVSTLPSLITTAQTTANNATTSANNKLPLTGGTMSGGIELNTFNLTTVGNLEAVNVSATGRTYVGAGTIANLGLSITTDTDTGIYSSGADTLNIVNGGFSRIITSVQGCTLIGPTTISTLNGCGYSVIYANSNSFPPIYQNNALIENGTLLSIISGKLIRLYKIGITSAYMIRMSFTCVGNWDQINSHWPEFFNFGLSTAILSMSAISQCRFWKYTPDANGLFFISAEGGFKNGITYDIIGSMILTQDFDI